MRRTAAPAVYLPYLHHPDTRKHMAKQIDVDWVRKQFPALSREMNGEPVVYLDGPAGSQVPERVALAVRDYLTGSNANRGGAFPTSQETDALVDSARRAIADLLGTDDPSLIAFGPNMTTLTFALSRAMGKTWQRGDEIIVTQLDHDANITPWALAARDAGAAVQYVEIDAKDCTLRLDDLEAKLSERTRLVAIAAASNAVGTINPVRQIVELAHGAGAEVFVDAVHYAPHGMIDVSAWDCDYLVCSAYKFFGPHVGILWGRRQPMAKLPAYKVRPAHDEPPDRWETGTQCHEALAGVLETVEYLADLGRTVTPEAPDRRSALVSALDAIAEHERELAARLLGGLAELPDVDVLGIREPDRLADRVPTVSFTHARRRPVEIAQRLAESGIFVWAGHHYALLLTETLGLMPDGMLRVGPLHYNTLAEVNRLLEALAGID